jgi:hypothetical protein
VLAHHTVHIGVSRYVTIYVWKLPATAAEDALEGAAGTNRLGSRLAPTRQAVERWRRFSQATCGPLGHGPLT